MLRLRNDSIDLVSMMFGIEIVVYMMIMLSRFGMMWCSMIDFGDMLIVCVVLMNL